MCFKIRRDRQKDLRGSRYRTITAKMARAVGIMYEFYLSGADTVKHGDYRVYFEGDPSASL